MVRSLGLQKTQPDLRAYHANPLTGVGGNQITRVVGGVTFALTYDAENPQTGAGRLTGMSETELSASYVYDGDPLSGAGGNRVKRS